MLYFIRCGECIKIGHGKVKERYGAAKTWAPFPPEIVMAIDLPNEYEAEQALHRRFADFRTNGEWFLVNLTSMVRALIDLKLIPENPQPLLDLPVVDPPPPFDTDFSEWFLATRDPVTWLQADVDDAKRNLEKYWQADHQGERCRFLKLKAKYGDLRRMIEAGRPMTDEETSEFFSELRLSIRRNDLDSSPDSKRS